MNDARDQSAGLPVIVLANPFSGAKSNVRRVGRLTEALGRRGIEARVVWTPRERDELLDDPDLGKKCRCLVAAGGDGTAAGVFNRRVDVPLTLLPLGNENLLAKEFGLGGGAERVAAAIAAGKTASIDLGRVNGRRFALMASAGFDAAVVRRVDQWRNHAREDAALRRIRRISYLEPFVETLFRYDCPRLTLEADGRRVEGCHALVFNINRYGGGLSFAPAARGDDGVLDYVVFQRPGGLNLLRYLMGVATGRHGRYTDVATGQARKIRITAEEAAPIQADGDPAGQTPGEISVEEKCLRVVTP